MLWRLHSVGFLFCQKKLLYFGSNLNQNIAIGDIIICVR